MIPEEFIILFQQEIETNKEAFISNMHNLNLEDKKFCEWVEIFIAWMELADEEDCEMYYKSYD